MAEQAGVQKEEMVEEKDYTLQAVKNKTMVKIEKFTRKRKESFNDLIENLLEEFYKLKGESGTITGECQWPDLENDLSEISSNSKELTPKKEEKSKEKPENQQKGENMVDEDDTDWYDRNA